MRGHSNRQRFDPTRSTELSRAGSPGMLIRRVRWCNRGNEGKGHDATPKGGRIVGGFFVCAHCLTPKDVA